MPKTNHSTPDLSTLVSEFVDQVQIVVRRSTIDQIQAALGSVDAPMRRGPGRPRGPGRRPGRRAARQTPAQLDAMVGKVHAYIREHPGQRSEQISKALKVQTPTLRKAVQKLISEKKLRAKGQRRGMTYTAA